MRIGSTRSGELLEHVGQPSIATYACSRRTVRRVGVGRVVGEQLASDGFVRPRGVDAWPARIVIVPTDNGVIHTEQAIVP